MALTMAESLADLHGFHEGVMYVLQCFVRGDMLLSALQADYLTVYFPDYCTTSGTQLNSLLIFFLSIYSIFHSVFMMMSSFVNGCELKMVGLSLEILIGRK